MHRKIKITENINRDAEFFEKTVPGIIKDYSSELTYGKGDADPGIYYMVKRKGILQERLISIFPDFSGTVTIYVHSPSLLDLAKKVGEEYERIRKGESTIKTDFPLT